MIAATAFVLIAAALCGMAVLALFGITHVAMSGSEAVERDGLHRGWPAPAWSLADSAGHMVISPPAGPLQMAVFTGHSLKSFPSVADGLRQVTGADAGLEAVILLRSASRIAEPVPRALGLTGIPVVAGSPSPYGRYNVRVTPFVIFMDPVRCRGIARSVLIAALAAVALLNVRPRHVHIDVTARILLLAAAALLACAAAFTAARALAVSRDAQPGLAP